MGIASQLGPKPEGNPGAMRAVAGQLARAAGQIERAAAPVLDLVSPDAFRGPGRSSVDAGFQEVQSRARVAAAQLDAESARLMHEAGQLEQAIHAWEARKARLEAEARTRAEQAARARQQEAGR